MPLRKLWNSICGSAVQESAKTAPPESKPKVNRGSRREVKSFARQLRSREIASVLEIAVNDPVTSVALVEALTADRPDHPPLYVAVDRFEAGGNSLTLKDFHRSLRQSSVRAQLVPMDIAPGVDRVIRTVGLVDLVLWSLEREPSDAEAALLSRAVRQPGAVYRRSGGRWEATAIAPAHSARAA